MRILAIIIALVFFNFSFEVHRDEFSGWWPRESEFETRWYVAQKPFQQLSLSTGEGSDSIRYSDPTNTNQIIEAGIIAALLSISTWLGFAGLNYAKFTNFQI